MKTRKFTWAFPLVFGAGGLLLIGPSLTSCSSTCSDEHSCGAYQPPDGTSGASGNGATDAGGASSGNGGKATTTGGKAGNSSGGSSMQGGAPEEAGTGGAEGGAGGSPVQQPCNGACKAPKPVCDEPSDACVECLKEADCAAGAKKKCDLAAKACVECLAPTDCATATSAKCDGTGTCVKCTSNDDCSHIAGKGVCDTKAGECVQCTGKDYAACGQSMGKALVCDTLSRTCTTNKERGADLCAPCVSDAQCLLGQLCVKEQYGAPTKQDVGYFCFWKKGAAVGGAPSLCTSAHPYITTLTNQTSIDGEAADVCELRSSTCIAKNQFSSKDCKTGGAADDQKCGFAPTKDSQCGTFDTDVFRCTMACASDDDCPGALLCGGNSFCKLQP